MEYLSELISTNEVTVALAGNPNTGKSTVFNNLTGLNQHTGNWPGKTVVNARGKYNYKDQEFTLVDLPGTYSLLANSLEEEIARDFICFANPQLVVIVVDATCLERNLILLLQLMEATNNLVLCVNLMDEAKRKGINVDLDKLTEELGIPVVGTNAREGVGLEELKATIKAVANGEITPKPMKIKYDDQVEELLEKMEKIIEKETEQKFSTRCIAVQFLARANNIDKILAKELVEDLKDLIEGLDKNKIWQEDIQDRLVMAIVKKSEAIFNRVVDIKNENYNEFDRKLDNIVTSRLYGIPIMLSLLGLVFWLTIKGANYPSQLLASLFFKIEGYLIGVLRSLPLPQWFYGLTVFGVYRTLAWVISVMLPPMAIFFPLFTILEDFGYLPRIAFNLDNFFKRACAHGKQALTMCMGFGCNAAGVISCRIIDSPRERLIAIITNNFVPCNGRFPILISVALIFIGGTGLREGGTFLASLTVLAVVLLGIIMTLVVSKILSISLLKGLPSSFILELPPYRKPQLGKILTRSIFDRTLFVLARAIVVAAPAGIIIWLMANMHVGDLSILQHTVDFLDPFARLIGMDGHIMIGFILGLPANEIVIPIIVMSYMSKGAMLELSSLGALRQLLISNGWTWVTAVSVMLFTLMHFPCGTTLLTIKKETLSKKWTLVSFVIPTLVGVTLCFVFTQVVKLMGLG